MGLGEATHGTDEFFELKHRLVRFLVRELGIRLIGLEADFAALAVDDYVVSGGGDPATALDGLHLWTWQTEELLALVEWLREYNEGRPDAEKVRFYGYDAQFATGSARCLAAFFDRVDPDYLGTVRDELAVVEAGLAGHDADDVRAWLDAAATVADSVGARLDRREDSYRSVTSDREWRLVRRHRRVVEQAYEFMAARTVEGTRTPRAVRDAAMAENVAWLLDHEDADRSALWAHNDHVATGSFRGGDWETPPKRMGQHLRESFGDDYYALGLEFGRGSFRAYPEPGSDAPMDVRPFSLDSLRPDSWAATFAEVGASPWVLDVESAAADATLREWLDAERPLHDVGAAHYEDEDRLYTPANLREEFDGIGFVATTTSAEPLANSDA